MNEVLSEREIEERDAIWGTRDLKARVTTIRFLCSLDVKRIAYSLVAVGARFGCTCIELMIDKTGGDLGKEIEDDDVGMDEGRGEGFEVKEKGVLVHVGGFSF
ncbi:unnamed protein product [Sphenostylis stenocarpa]|uniref:Uncharacterized protein n=1 Tax=Sphenostylis stenocarpa TaxID=92480 RepID=A0AA86W3B4_9FABA|nr:unnamed protein product [Sphenostylis stenocarpa]